MNTDLLLALVRCTFLTAQEKVILAKKLDNIEALTVLSIEDIQFLVGRKTKPHSWEPKKLPFLVERDHELMKRYSISFVPVISSKFPALLREIPEVPFALFWRGILPHPEIPLVSLVGTRMPSGEGAMGAARIASEFAQAHIPVVSGLARGVDAFAHKGVLDGGGITHAVLACGLDQVYPRGNARLAQRIVETGGSLISEYSPSELPLTYRFPQRNRIISGLARATLVVEAPEKSGALITADFALEQGRDLYVYARTLNSKRGHGTKCLQMQGAQSVSNAFDIYKNWDIDMPYKALDSNTSFCISTSPHGEQLSLDFLKQLPY